MNPQSLTRFKGRRVFVTGDTGFKGSWLCLWLHDLGAEVAGFALPPDGRTDLFRRLGLSKMIRHQDGDIRDAKVLSKAVTAFKPEFVFHLAAQALVRRSYAEPVLTFETNVVGSVNLLDAVRATPSVRSLVYVTSDKCYKNKGLARGYKETDELGGDDPYSASKAAAEVVLKSYQESFFKTRTRLGTASARAGNVIGGGDLAEDRIVPDAVQALLTRRPLVLRAPQAVRPWQHVLDPLFGYLLLGAGLADAPNRHTGAWNFGPAASQSRSVAQLVRRFALSWGVPLKIAVKRSPLKEAHTLRLDAGKAARLGWRPRLGFSQSVDWTAAWYKAAAEGGSALEMTRRQIHQYLV